MQDKEEILKKRREYARVYRKRLKERKLPKKCEKCKEKEVTHKYCKECAREVRLERYRILWASDEKYRERHRLAAKMSFRRKKATNVTKTD